MQSDFIKRFYNFMTIYRHKNKIKNTRRVNFRPRPEIVFYFIFYLGILEKIILAKKTQFY